MAFRRKGNEANSDLTALAGRTICLIHRGNLRYASRLLTEIRALGRAGARVLVLSPHPASQLPNADFEIITATEEASESVFEDQRRGPFSAMLSRLLRRSNVSGAAALEVDPQLSRLIEERSIDLLWIIDWPMMSRYLDTARSKRVPVLYETLDLLPEQASSDELKAALIQKERVAFDYVTGFVTAGATYADYYESSFAGLGVKARPVVRDNAPDTQVERPRPTSRPVRCLFMGCRTINRNLPNIVSAVAASTSDFTLTLQGENRLGEQLSDLIRELGLEGRVFLKDPVAPEMLVETAAQFDVGVVSLEPVSMNERLAASTKVFTYMAAGLAVIGSDLPGIRSTVGRHGLGPLVPSTSVEDWARAFDAVCGLPTQEIDALKQRSLTALEEHSWEVQGPLFLGEFARAMARPKRGRR